MKKSFLLMLSLIAVSTAQASFKDGLAQNRNANVRYQDLDVALYPSGPDTMYDRNRLIWSADCGVNKDPIDEYLCLRDAQKQVTAAALFLVRAVTKIKSIVHVSSIPKDQQVALKYKSLDMHNKNLIQVIANPDLNNRSTLSVDEIVNNDGFILEAK